MSGNVQFENQKYIYGTDTDGNRQLLAGLNQYNRFLFGYGGWYNGVGATQLMGNTLILSAKDGDIATDGVVSTHYQEVYKPTSITLSTSEQKLSFTDSWGNDPAGILSPSDGGILCGKDGIVLVTAQLYVGSGLTEGDIIRTNVYKNSSSTRGSICRAGGAYDTFVINQFIHSATSGDIFYLYAYNQTAARGVVENSVITKLCVQYID